MRRISFGLHGLKEIPLKWTNFDSFCVIPKTPKSNLTTCINIAG